MMYGTSVDSLAEQAILDQVAQALHRRAGDLAKVDRYEDVRNVLLDLLDETKTKTGDVFDFAAVTVDGNLLRFAGYLLTIMEVE